MILHKIKFPLVAGFGPSVLIYTESYQLWYPDLICYRLIGGNFLWAIHELSNIQ